MAITFKVPDSPNKSILEIDNFQGADFTNTPATVDIHKSPNLINMVRDVPGKIRKSMGYSAYRYVGSGPINGAYEFESLDTTSYVIGENVYIKRWLVHSGTELYASSENTPNTWNKVATGLKNGPSMAWPLGESLFISDGYKLWRAYLKTETINYVMSVEASTVSVASGTSPQIVFDGSTLRYSLANLSTTPNTKWYENNGSTDIEITPKATAYYAYAYLPFITGPIKAIKCKYGSTVLTSKLGINYTQKIVHILDATNKRIQLMNVYDSTSTRYISSMTATATNMSTGEATTLSINTPVENSYKYIYYSTLSDGSYRIFINVIMYQSGGYLNKSKEVYLKIADGVATEYDGTAKNFVVEKCENSENVYIPKLTISKNPTGGGTAYEDLNMLNPAFMETFVVTSTTASAKIFHLSFSGLDSRVPKVEVMDANGNFVSKEVSTDFTVDYVNGIITFVTAPGVSPVTGEDNVKITAYRTVAKYAKKINSCSIGALFGVNGATDRLFLSGNTEYPNYDWYSGQNDGTYFPDTGYSIVGRSDSAIVGYSIINNYLAAHKDDSESDRNVIIRQGNLVSDKPQFPIVAILQGAGAIAPRSFQYLEAEPLFLTNNGIYAITAQDITGEKYGQNRSYFLDGKLKNESNPQNAISCIYNNQYLLCLNSHVYILDGLQAIQTDKSMPYATRQYAGFYRENIPATAIWVWDDILYFGSSDGMVYKFYTDKTDVNSYNDNGTAITCQYDTPDFNGEYFFKNKTFRYLAVRLDAAIRTSIQYWVMRHGIWTYIKTESGKPRWIDFANMNFAKFSFSTDSTQKTLHTKIRIKKVDKARFRFINDQLNEPFGLYNFAVEYIENGNYKG